MSPGDVSMLLNETSGLRVQMTSPGLGAANVRIEGLRGRYSQILSDGLPLYGRGHRSESFTTHQINNLRASDECLISRDKALLLRCATSATVSAMKSRVITQRELRNQSAAVLREVEAGRTIVVTRNGTPVGELRPIRRHRFVARAAIADAAGRAPRIDARRFRADLDAVIDPHIDD